MSTTLQNDIDVDISEALAALRALPPRATVARETARLRRDVLDGSLAISGAVLSRPQLDALIDRGLATGDHPLDAYVDARDLAAAAAWTSEQRALDAGDPRPLMTIEDVRRLHILASAGRPDARPGVWRLAVEPAAGGVVSPAPWLIAKETAALVDRFRRRPAPGDVPAWVAGFLTRFARIRPFAAANGRTARLCAALLLRRLDLPPVAIARERVAAYRSALEAGKSGPPHALTVLLEDALLQSCLRLIAAAGDDPLVPLRALAGDRYAMLIKAAKRKRLRVVVRDGRVLSTAHWVAAYRNPDDRGSSSTISG